MTVYSKIIKRNRRQRLGRYNKQLVIRLSLTRKLTTSNRYSLVLTRRRARADSRYDLIGTFVYIKSPAMKATSCLYINISKFKQALLHGAIIHTNVYKLLLN